MSRLDSPSLIQLIRELVCSNQNSLSQYIYSCNEKHKRLKEVVSSLRGVKDPHGLSSLIMVMEERVLELEEYAYSKFENAFNDGFRYISKYFESDSKYFPRACIKVISDNQVVPLVRRPRSFDFMEAFNAAPGDNSAFDEIMGNPAKHYLCNDIPNAARLNQYKNRRLEQDVLRQAWEYSPDRVLPDDDWRKCWKRVSFIQDGEEILPPIEPPIEMCYRSTLVIPLSLLTQNLNDDFINQFNISKVSETTVFGFLCLDHPETDFFVNDDVHFGYVVADLLSLYVIQQLMYTDYSSVYQLACSVIAEYYSEEA